MNTENLKKEIIEDMKSSIIMDYEEDKKELGSDFNAADFQSTMYRNEKTHFCLHPSTGGVFLLENIKKNLSKENENNASEIEEAENNLFHELFKTAWNQFAKEIKGDQK